jgi:hypothetical protein
MEGTCLLLLHRECRWKFVLCAAGGVIERKMAARQTHPVSGISPQPSRQMENPPLPSVNLPRAWEALARSAERGAHIGARSLYVKPDGTASPRNCAVLAKRYADYRKTILSIDNKFESPY